MLDTDDASGSFAVEAWRIRASWQAGVEHSQFLAFVVCTAIFAYFCGALSRARGAGAGAE
jgi:hypothetical protein